MPQKLEKRGTNSPPAAATALPDMLARLLGLGVLPLVPTRVETGKAPARRGWCRRRWPRCRAELQRQLNAAEGCELRGPYRRLAGPLRGQRAPPGLRFIQPALSIGPCVGRLALLELAHPGRDVGGGRAWMDRGDFSRPGDVRNRDSFRAGGNVVQFGRIVPQQKAAPELRGAVFKVGAGSKPIPNTTLARLRPPRNRARADHRGT